MNTYILTSWGEPDSYNLEIGDAIMHRMINDVGPNKTWIVDKIMYESFYRLIYLGDDGAFTTYDYQLGI